MGKLALILKLNFNLRRKAFEDFAEIELGRANSQSIGSNPKSDKELYREKLFLDCHLKRNAIVILVLHKLTQVDDNVLVSSKLNPDVQ